jgi:hypothetical protein
MARIMPGFPKVTGTPRWRSPMPSVNPASPPPTIVMGFAAMVQAVRCAMNKWLNKRRAVRSIASRRPARARKVRCQKSRAHAHRRVVPRHRCNQSPKAAGCKTAARRAARLDGDEQARAPGNHAKQFGQARVVEMVQKQIGDDDFRRGRKVCGQSKTSATIASARQPSDVNAASVSRAGRFLAVEQCYAHIRPARRHFLRHAQQKMSVARAEFGDLFRRRAVQRRFAARAMMA